MGCGCSKRRGTVIAGQELIGYYVVLPDGREVPKVSAGEAPFLSAVEARVEVRRAGGGTIRPMKRKAR